jgi:hypothetical protein
MSYLRFKWFVVVAACLCLLPISALAQEGGPRMDHSVTVRPKPNGVTPRTPDGHPDFSGVWNGMADNLLGIPNQMHNEGIAVENNHSTYDVLSGAKIATWPLAKPNFRMASRTNAPPRFCAGWAPTGRSTSLNTGRW